MSAFSALDPVIVDRPDGPPVIVVTGTQSEPEVQRPHQHARGQLLGAHHGLLTVGMAEAVWVMPTVHAVWLPPNHVHWVRSHGPCESWAAYVAESACGDLPAQPCMIHPTGLLREALLRAAAWPVDMLDEASERLARVIIDEIRCTQARPLGLSLPHDPRLLRIAHALLEDPAQERSLAEWADWAAVSDRTLSRRFVAETGFNFTTWRQRARIIRALELLATDKQISAIALDLGYATASAFIAVFRQIIGETPAEYRQQLQPRRR